MAASIKMRKYDEQRLFAGHSLTFNVAASIKMRKYIWLRAIYCDGPNLQCGRIYKDAEIKEKPSGNDSGLSLQCGRIYKDAEIRRTESRTEGRGISFNVAASIKMRKWTEAPPRYALLK